ncbi:metal-dependent hydrolase [Pararhodobacter marinus]|uniref:Metal-dependent hydrolase n=1 Tax=Pararhodobacter marinus TaxID=2184063 RepID=A0A2U2CCQ5_9RHOB|nr:endonuclease/exonuclease/phosphatase family protein [Pararhodobacter marinus]PWE29639.1 metal-dependent hydrolase [Pararhodobacter marinus]
MRLVCLNAWGGTLHDALIPWLQAETADIFCLQEVIHSPGAAQNWLEYRDGAHVLPQRARMLDELRAALPGHVATFCPAATGVLWDGDRTVPSHWGLASVIRDTVPVIGQVQGFVHKSYSAAGFGAHPRSRPAHVFRIWDGGRPVVVAQMHGLRDPSAGKADTPERAAQAARLIALIDALREPGDGLIVCGDFNVEPDSETLTRLRALGLRELVSEGGFPGTRTARYTKPGRFADYLLVSDEIRVRRFDVLYQPEISDHCPLVLDF